MTLSECSCIVHVLVVFVVSDSISLIFIAWAAAGQSHNVNMSYQPAYPHPHASVLERMPGMGRGSTKEAIGDHVLKRQQARSVQG